MQDFIAALMAALGTILVLAGATVTVLKPMAVEPAGTTSDSTAPVPGWKKVARRLDGGERLILWGVILLVLAAVAAGAISFNFGASAGSGKPV